MNDEKLIDCVKEYTEIYDTTHAKHLDNNHKSSLWKKIAEEINEPNGTVCKKRWINIRDQFRKSLNKRKTKNGQLDTSQKKYKYEETLQFLIPYMHDRITISNMDPVTDNSMQSFNEHDHHSSTDDVDDDDEANTVRVVNNNNETYRTEPYSMRKKKKRKTESASATVMKYLLANNSLLTVGVNKHPIDTFLEGLAPTLKNLPPYYQHLAKGKIFSIVQDTEAAAFYSSYSQPSGITHSSNSFRSSGSNEQRPAQNDPAIHPQSTKTRTGISS